LKRLVAISAFVAIGLVARPALSQEWPAMTAHFIDVGQAHAPLLEFPCGALLIDAGTQDDEHETKLLVTSTTGSRPAVAVSVRTGCGRT
jgi:beta-lactamase superfamily II metal-dependent hydrolase